MRDPIERARELKAPSNLGTYVVIYHALVEDPQRIEGTVHRRLSKHHVEGEWFEVCPNLAKEAILACAGTVFFEDTVARWPSSQRSPQGWTRVALREAARKRREADEEARRIAQEKLVRRAREIEKARQAKELAEHQRAAEEREKEAARAQQAAINAENRRKVFAGVVQAVAGVATVLVPAVAVWVALRAAVRPFPDAAIASLQSRFTQEQSLAEALVRDLETRRSAVSRLESDLAALRSERVTLNRELAEARKAVIAARQSLRDKHAELSAREELSARTPEGNVELANGGRVIASLEKDVSAASERLRQLNDDVGDLPERERRAAEALTQARAARAALEPRVVQQVREAKAAENSYNAAVRHNSRWKP